MYKFLKIMTVMVGVTYACDFTLEEQILLTKGHHHHHHHGRGHGHHKSAKTGKVEHSEGGTLKYTPFVGSSKKEDKKT